MVYLLLTSSNFIILEIMGLNQEVLKFAKDQKGHRVDYLRGVSGQCWDLAEKALEIAGAKTSTILMGRVGPKANYRWGTQVKLNQVKPGDIIQFRDYKFKIIVETEHSNGNWNEREDHGGRPHHTAIVKQIIAPGKIRVLEQNVRGKRTVHENVLYFGNSKIVERQGDEVVTTEIKSWGTIWFYRPVKK